MEIADTLIKSNTMDIIVIDSVAALVPKSELEGEMGDHHIGAQARLMSQALRKITHSLATNNKTILIFTNQIRMKVGVLFGSPEVTSGGNALKFYASVRLDVRKIAVQKKGEDATGTQIRVTVTKNKVAPPFQKVIMELEFGKGISKMFEIVDIGVSCGVLEKSGSWYSYGDLQLGHGRDKSKIYLEEHPEVCEKITKEIRAKLLKPGGGPPPSFVLPEPEVDESDTTTVTSIDEEIEKVVTDV